MGLPANKIIDAAERFGKNPGGWSNLGDGLDNLARIGLQEGVDAAAAEEGADAGIAITAAAEAVGLSVGWVVLLCLMGIIVGGKLTEKIWLLAADRLPWPFGGAVRTIVHLVFGPLDNLEAWVGQHMADVATKLIISWLKAFRQFLIFELGVPLATGGGVTTAQYNHLQNEINQTNTRVKKLEYEYSVIQSHVNGATAPAPGVAPLADRITRLERAELIVAHDLNVLHSDISQLSQNQDSLHRTVTQLQVNLNAVRTVAFSAQDVLDELTRTTANVEHQLTQISPIVDANARQIALLSPLGLLLVNGMPGLRNLEKLERKPCQCPQLPGLPGDDAGLLAAYEFVTNG